jgi:general secretion pathway protein F
MPVYKYRAKEGPHKIIENKIDAISQEAAIKQIEEMGYVTLGIEEIADSASGSRKRVTKKISTHDLIIFTRQLATLLKSGIPILRALGVLSEQTHNSGFSVVIKDIYNELKEGANFSQALSKYPGIFSPFYIAMISAGEDSGRLEEILFRLSEYSKKRQELVSKVRLAMVYPIIMGLVGAGTVIFMFSFVMPRLMSIFDTLGDNLPTPTKMLIGLSAHLSQHWWIYVIAVFGLFLIIRYEARKKGGKRLFSAVSLKIPIAGELMLKKELALLSRTLELLIKSGIPILRAIELTAPVISNVIIRDNFLEGYNELKQGESLGKTLKRFKVFPSFMTNLLSIGEESGKLDLPLTELADSYEKDTEDSIKVFTTILEPVMILGLGLIIGFIVIAMLLPIFEMNMMVG